MMICRQTQSAAKAFTLIELLVVMAIIIILAGLVVATTGYVQEKGKRSRTEAEIAAISAALENYKADNGIYPTGTDTEALNPTNDGNSATNPANAYTKASLELYSALTGTANGDRTPPAGAHSYFTFKPQMLYPVTPPNAQVICIRDPFGNCYGYSTVKAKNPAAIGGYNPTFDLWSTGGEISAANPDQAKWIKNW